MYSIEGIATISKGSFRFDSGLPSDEPAVKAQNLLGRLHISENASVTFCRKGVCANLPPDIVPVGEGDGYKIKRTTQHYLIQLKVPIGETRAEMEQRILRLLPLLLGDITIDRMEAA